MLFDIGTASRRVAAARSAADHTGAASIPLKRLAELGVCRVSFGGLPLALAMAHLQNAAAQLTALGDYPSEISFDYPRPVGFNHER